ncbi:MAG: hypothetical protein WC538_11840 [Thermoanaerobaculia bacterium]|jgi:hypothetical protein
MNTRSLQIIAVVSIGIATTLYAQQPAAPAGADHVAAIKQSLQKSTAVLRQYEWVETTAVSIKGEEKSRTQNNCYYGAEGNLQKTPIGAPAPADKKGGVRGKVIEKKKEEMSAATKEAIDLVKRYVPPDTARIQAAKDAGRLTLTPPDPKGRIVVVIKDYLKPGDSLTFEVNAANDRINRVTVSTFTDTAKDAVSLDVAYGAFADGTVYPATTQLKVASQNLAVAIENSGYKKLGG